MSQAQDLAVLFKELPDFFKNHSGGLVKAMVEFPEWEVVALSKPLKDDLDP
jgi:hypothetical protein